MRSFGASLHHSRGASLSESGASGLSNSRATPRFSVARASVLTTLTPSGGNRRSFPGRAARVRSTFRDRAAEESDHPREVIEAALAHGVRDRVESACARPDLFERPRVLTDDWARYPVHGRGEEGEREWRSPGGRLPAAGEQEAGSDPAGATAEGRHWRQRNRRRKQPGGCPAPGEDGPTISASGGKARAVKRE